MSLACAFERYSVVEGVKLCFGSVGEVGFDGHASQGHNFTEAMYCVNAPCVLALMKIWTIIGMSNIKKSTIKKMRQRKL